MEKMVRGIQENRLTERKPAGIEEMCEWNKIYPTKGSPIKHIKSLQLLKRFKMPSIFTAMAKQVFREIEISISLYDVH